MVDTVTPQSQQLIRRLASPLSRYKRFTMPKFYPDAAGPAAPAAPAAPAPVAPAPIYQGRLAPTTAQINAGITKFNNYQRKNPGKVGDPPPDPYGPAVGAAPNIGLGSFNSREAAAAAAAATAAPVAPYVSPRDGVNRISDAGKLLTAATVLPFGTGVDYLRQGATYMAGGDVNSLKGGKNAIADGMKTEAFGALDRLRSDFAQSQADMRDMLGAKAAADPAAIDMKMVEEARRRRAAAATATPAATAAPAAAAKPAAKPAATAAPTAAAPTQAAAMPNNGSYWIDSSGKKHEITWDANGNLLTGTRNANDPGVRQDRELNRKAILADTQPLYTGKQYNGRDPALMDRYDARQKAALDAVTAQREAAIEQMGGWTVRSNNRDFTVMDPITREEIFTIEVPDATSPSGIRSVRVNARGVPVK